MTAAASGRSALAVVAALSVALAGCASAGSTGAAPAASRPPVAATITSADLLGYRSSGPPVALVTVTATGASARCLGITGTGPRSATRAAPLVERGDLVSAQVLSGSARYSSPRRAASVAAALDRQRAAECLQASVRALLVRRSAAQKLRWSRSVQATRLPAALPAGSSFGYRLALAAAAPPYGTEATFAVYVDLVGFAAGDRLEELATVSTRTLFPASTEHRLLRLLLRRAGVPSPRS